MPTRSRPKSGSIRTPGVEVNLSSGRGWLRFSCPYCGDILFHGWSQPNPKSEATVKAHVEVCRLAERQSWVDQLLYHRGVLLDALIRVERVQHYNRPRQVVFWDCVCYNTRHGWSHGWRNLMEVLQFGNPAKFTKRGKADPAKSNPDKNKSNDPKHYCLDGTSHHWRLGTAVDANGASLGVCIKCQAEARFTGGYQGVYARMNEMAVEGETVGFKDGESLEELAGIEQSIEANREE